MAKSPSSPNNTLSMPSEKADNPGPVHACFDASIDVSPAAPLDPKALPALGAVYLLSDADDTPIFLSVCENLRRVVPPRLAADSSDEPTKRAKLGDITRRIRWKRTRGAFEGLLWHWRIARDIFPDRYASMLGFGPCALLRVDPAAAFPRFEPTNVIRDDGARYFGPIPRRRDAEALVRLLEDAFDLCRDYDILQRTPNGDRCAYFDMGRCPAPCDGTAPMSIYRQSIDEALTFLLAPTEANLTPVQRRMRVAAESLAFESAAAYKRVFDDALRLPHRTSFAYLNDVSAATWIAVVRASVKRKNTDETRLKAYRLTRGAAFELQTGAAGDIQALSDAWRQETPTDSSPRPTNDARLMTESMRLLSRFLFKENQRDVFIFPHDRWPAFDAWDGALAPLLDTRRRL